MLKVHHLNRSQSERIVWLCEELGLDYELVHHTRRADNYLAPDSLKAVHPLGVAPVIEDGDVVLPESGAICDYIVAKHGNGKLVPAVGDPDFAGHLLWFHFANGQFMANAFMEIALMQAGVKDIPPMIADRKAKGWAAAEARLGEAPFFGGRHLTTADIMMGFLLTTLRGALGGKLDDYPNIAAYLQRIGQREAYRAAMAKAEPGIDPVLT